MKCLAPLGLSPSDFLGGYKGTNLSDAEIIEGIKLLARTEGIFAETAGGVTIATLAKLAREGVIRPDEVTVAIVSGHGLKTVEALDGAVAPTHTIPATLAAFDAAIGFDDPILA